MKKGIRFASLTTRLKVVFMTCIALTALFACVRGVMGETITIGSNTTSPGSTVSIPVTAGAGGFTGIGSTSFEIQYPTDYLNATTVTNGGSLGSFTSNINDSLGKITAGSINLSGDNVAGGATFFSISFGVAPGAPDGPITLSFIKADLTDTTLPIPNPIAASMADGSITVAPESTTTTTIASTTTTTEPTTTTSTTISTTTTTETTTTTIATTTTTAAPTTTTTTTETTTTTTTIATTTTAVPTTTTTTTSTTTTVVVPTTTSTTTSTTTTTVICQCPDDIIDPTGCISGRVANLTGEPPDRKTVKLKRVSPRRPRVRKIVETGSDGCFNFTDLPDGTYQIKARCRGRLPRFQNVEIAGGGKTNGVDFTCRR